MGQRGGAEGARTGERAGPLAGLSGGRGRPRRGRAAPRRQEVFLTGRASPDGPRGRRTPGGRSAAPDGPRSDNAARAPVSGRCSKRGHWTGAAGRPGGARSMDTAFHGNRAPRVRGRGARDYRARARRGTASRNGPAERRKLPRARDLNQRKRQAERIAPHSAGRSPLRGRAARGSEGRMLGRWICSEPKAKRRTRVPPLRPSQLARKGPARGGPARALSGAPRARLARGRNALDSLANK